MPTAPAEDKRSFIERMTGKKAPADKKPDGTPAAPGAAAPGAPAKPKVAKPKPALPQDPDYEKIAEAAGRGAASAMAKAKGEGTATPPKPDDGLNDKQKRTLSVLERMEKEYPEDNTGIAKAFAESVKKAVAYQKAWEAGNPGKKFDADDDEHEDFFKENEVDWDEDDYADVVALLRAEQVAKRSTETLTPKLEEINRREQLRLAEPRVMAQQITAARGFWKELGDEYAKVLDEHGGIAMAEVERLRTEDPARAIAFETAQHVESFAAELHRLTLQDSEGKPLYPFNEKLPAHQFIAEFIANEEASMQALDPEQQLDDKGRRFATAEEYFAMTPARQKHYWRFTDADLSHIYASREAARVKAAIAAENEKFEKTASARGYVRNGSGGNPAAQPPVTSVPTPALTTAKPTSPAGTVEPLGAPMSKAGNRGNNSASSSFVNRWLGRG